VALARRRHPEGRHSGRMWARHRRQPRTPSAPIPGRGRWERASGEAIARTPEDGRVARRGSTQQRRRVGGRRWPEARTDPVVAPRQPHVADANVLVRDLLRGWAPDNRDCDVRAPRSTDAHIVSRGCVLPADRHRRLVVDRSSLTYWYPRYVRPVGLLRAHGVAPLTADRREHDTTFGGQGRNGAGADSSSSPRSRRRMVADWCHSTASGISSNVKSWPWRCSRSLRTSPGVA
jgi:hypothetical protein